MASVGAKDLFSQVAASGATNGTAVSMDNSDSEIVGFINISAIGAGTTLTAKIQHSPDNTNWFDLIAFTAATATGAEIKQLGAGVGVLNYVRGTLSFSGGTTTATVTMKLYHSRK